MLTLSICIMVDALNVEKGIDFYYLIRVILTVAGCGFSLFCLLHKEQKP